MDARIPIRVEPNSGVRSDKVDPERFAEQEVFSLVPLPCWKDLSPEADRPEEEQELEQGPEPTSGP